jgi:hypothetical protein
VLGLQSAVSLLIPLTESFLTFFAFKIMVPAERSDYFPAISVWAGSALRFLRVTGTFEGHRQCLGGVIFVPDLVRIHERPGPVRCHPITFSTDLRSRTPAIV